MDCRRFRSLIPRYLSERIGEAQRDEFQAHASACLPCNRSLTGRRALREAVSSGILDAQPAPRDLKDNIRVCMECMDHPGRRICPRLRFKMRLVEPVPVE